MRALLVLSAATLLTFGCETKDASPGTGSGDEGAHDSAAGGTATGGTGGHGGGTGGDGADGGGHGGAASVADAGEPGDTRDAAAVDATSAACAGRRCGELCNSCPPTAPLCPGAVAYCSSDGQCVIGSPPACGTPDGGSTVDAADVSAHLNPCPYPQPYVLRNKPTGLERCPSGVSYRVRAVDCPSLLPRANAACTPSGPPGGGGPEPCAQDSDCKAKPLGTCMVKPGHFGGCGCLYGCVRDSDCGAGEICECGDPTGVCRPSGCIDSTSCAPGSLCASVATTFGGCSWTPPLRGYQCQAKGDTCLTDEDCAGATPACAFSSATGVRACHEGQLACP
jgi:hypothetical protein